MAGVSPRTGILAGNPNSSWIPDDVTLAVVLALQNASGLPCYSFRLLKERDPMSDAPDGDTSEAITYDPELSEGDFSTIDPDTTEPNGKLAPAYELNGNEEVPVGTIIALRPSQGGKHFTFSHPVGAESIFEAVLTGRALVATDYYQFSWKYPDNTPGGTIPLGKATLAHTQTATGSIPDIYVLTIYATAGTYFLVDGSPTADLPWDTSAATVQAALTNFVVSGTLVLGNPYVLTFTGIDNSLHVLTVDTTNLVESTAHDPAEFLNVETPVEFLVGSNNLHVWLKKLRGGKAELTSKVIKRGNYPANTQQTKIHLDIKNVVDGVFLLRFTEDDAWKQLPWDCTALDIQTALSTLLTCTVTGTAASSSSNGTFDITITADYLPHKLLFDKTGLKGTTVYGVIWSDDLPVVCINRINHIALVDLDGYDETAYCFPATQPGTDGCLVLIPSEDCDLE